MITEAVILAGGRGTRLRSVVKNMPKPMALVGKYPFLHYVIEYLSKQGIRKIFLSVYYLKNQIIDYFADNYLGCEIAYIEEHEPLGTGGAVVNSLASINGNEFWLLNGDTYFPVNLVQQEAFHFANKAQITLALKYINDASRYGLVELNAQNVLVSFLEKGSGNSGYINGGVYLLTKNSFAGLLMGKNYSLELLLSQYIKQYKVMGFIASQPFIDIGIPEDYYKAASIIASN